MLGVLGVLGACTSFSAEEGSPPNVPASEGGGETTDASSSETSTTTCDETAPFEFVTALVGADNGAGAINTDGHERGATLTRDETTMIFHRETKTEVGLYITTRSSATGSFGAPKALPFEALQSLRDEHPALSPDGRWLYFDSNRGRVDASAGQQAIWRVQWLSPASNTWGSPVELVNLAPPVSRPFLGPNDELLYTLGDNVAFMSLARAQPSTGGGTPLPDAVNAPATSNSRPMLSADGRVLYFSRKTLNDFSSKIYRSVRARLDLPFGPPVALEVVGATESRLNLNVGGFDQSPAALSVDNCRLYFAKSAGGNANWDLFVATRTPK